MMSQSYYDDGFFKIDPECHIVGNMEPIKHFPGVKMWWKSIDSITRPLMQGLPPKFVDTLEPWEMQKSTDPENILRSMDKYGVDVACLLPEAMMDTTGYSSRWCTNGDTWAAVQTHPDRFIIEPNLSPIKHRGVSNAIWELEYWAEKGVKIFKYYSPEDTYINDPALWPFYKRAEELGIVLDIHTGFSWCPPGKSKYCLPVQLDDVARDFPNLKLVAFHMGYPYNDDLNMVAMGHPNVYLCLSLLVPWAMTAPYKFAKILGEAIRFVGSDRIIWGTDSAGYGAQIGAAVVGLRNFQIPEELQWKYGYLPLTDEDKHKIFGGNLAGLLGIDPTIRRIGNRASSQVGEKTIDEGNNMDSVYEVIASTPMGELAGKVALKIDGTDLSGVLSLGNHDNNFTGGTIENDKMTFSGELNTPMGKMPYNAIGTHAEGKIDAVAKTKMGNIVIKSR